MYLQQLSPNNCSPNGSSPGKEPAQYSRPKYHILPPNLYHKCMTVEIDEINVFAIVC